MNILVTGAAGFIGSHVCDHFIENGHNVIGLDNFDDFYPKKIKQLNIEGLLRNSRFQFYETDILDRRSLHTLFASHQIETVVHLAAKAGVRPSIASIEDYYEVNVNGTMFLLQAMKANGIKKMLFASSSSVYGNNQKVPFCETDMVDNPISPYASTKKSGELLCHVYSHLYGFDITCLRFFTVFGPRQRPDLAIHKFTKLIERGEQIPFYGDGSTARDYTYVADIVNGVSCALNNLNGYRIYNLGESRVTDLATLVKLIGESLGKKAILNPLPLQAGDVKLTYADISKARAEIGYNPRYSMKEGINEFTRWYLNHKGRLEA
jgi:UDP-glucuronate 4-epimerase